MSTKTRIQLPILAALAVLATVLALAAPHASAQSGGSPEGWVDRVEAVDGGVAVAGWALDADAPERSLNVHVYVDGTYADGRRASSARPDVNDTLGVPGDHGFGWTVPAPPDSGEVCVFALGIDAAGVQDGDNPLIGCVTLGGGATSPPPSAPSLGGSPRGWIDRVHGLEAGLAVAGWALDADAPERSLNVHVYVDGSYADGRRASSARPDVNDALGVPGDHGFGWTLPVPAGAHEVCIYALGVNAAGGQDGDNPLLGCADVVVGSGPAPGAPAPAPSPGGATIPGSGTFNVGIDVAPGTYAAVGTDGCYWERLSGFSGDFDDIISNSFGDGQRIVTIEATDVGFGTSRCGTWRPVSDAPGNPTIGDGVWLVGAQMTPGTWRTDGGDGCYRARLSGFSGELGDIVANDIGDGPAVVTIAAGDVGFESSRCGTWTRVG